jgi:hypothetical protein
MNKKALLVSAISVAALSAAQSGAWAAEGEVATLARITGDAVVSKGAQYVGATEGMVLKVGERVMSLAASSALVQFNDGCRYVLEANQLLTIENKSPCALGLVNQEQGVASAGAGAAGANLGWVPVAAVGVIAVPGIALDTGSENRGYPPPISP